jgi:hypothetical protein
MLCKMPGATRRNVIFVAVGSLMLLLPSLGADFDAGSAAAHGMGDTSAAMRANMAAYPEYFAPYSDAAAPRDRQCRNPRGIPASDWNCRER